MVFKKGLGLEKVVMVLVLKNRWSCSWSCNLVVLLHHWSHYS